MAKVRFSKDPKVRLVSIEEFINGCDYFCNLTKEYFWTNNIIPSPDQIYYKITSNYLICIFYSSSFTNFGMNIKEKLEKIVVAFRDGKTEYELLDNRILYLQNERKKYNKNENLDKKINAIIKVRKLLIEYKEKEEGIKKSFEEYLIDTGYKTLFDDLKNKYVVFDVETNGLRKSNDDLLSLSIYDPSTGICYNRYFPLDLQPLVLTSHIHGITDDDLADQVHMTQEEVDWLYNFFDLQNKTLLSYSGGKGTFDSSFVINYCKRHDIIGFENLSFENIKNMIPPAPFGLEGYLTKDNLCMVFGIEGVNKIHSSFNDCVLEWKLYEKLTSECVFFIQESLYKYTSEYLFPYSYLVSYPELITQAKIKMPNVHGNLIEVTRLNFSKKRLIKFKKYPINLIKMAFEYAINSNLHVEKQDNNAFLSKNKKKLTCMELLDGRIKERSVLLEDDDADKIIKLDDKENSYTNSANNITKMMIKYIKPIVRYLRKKVFLDKKIMAHELCISDDNKVFTICNLSDNKSIVEITSQDILNNDVTLKKGLATKLFYQSKGRDTYVLVIKFNYNNNRFIFNDLSIILYKVNLKIYDILR